MSNTLLKNFHLCFSKLKCLPPFLPPPPPPDSPTSPHHHHHDTTTTTTSTSPTASSSLVKNFNSIYDLTPEHYLPLSTTTTTAVDAASDNDDNTSSTTPDLASIYASQRFFFSSPGRSNSIIDSSSFLSSSSASSSSSLPETEAAATEPLIGSSAAGGVPIHKYSPDPYADFRRSMQEMIEARRFRVRVRDAKSEWEYLHELLLCYLSLNPKHMHKFIIGAFCDIVVGLTMSPPENDPRRRARGRRHQREVSRRLSF